MAQRTKAYVDTSAFIALLDKSDTHHSLFVRQFSDSPALMTSSLVISEGHAWFLRRYNEKRGLDFLDFIHVLKILEIVPVDAQMIRNAYKYLNRFIDQPLTLTDAVGLELMASGRVKHCWSTDRHLNLTGVPLVGW